MLVGVTPPSFHSESTNFWIEKLIPIAPIVLGEVHRVVCIAHQCFGILPILRENADADCGADQKVMGSDGIGRRNEIMYFLDLQSQRFLLIHFG